MSLSSMINSFCPECDCSSTPVPTAPEECEAPAPGVLDCNCLCHYQAQMTHLCQLDLEPATFPGPCTIDQTRNLSRGDAFTAKCTASDDPEAAGLAGYYDVVQYGPVAPAPLRVTVRLRT